MMDQVAYIGAGVLVFASALALVDARLSAARATALRYVLGLPLLAVYIYGVLSETLLGRTAADEPKAEFELFWSHRASLAVEDGSLTVTNAELFAEIILNILLFVPLGALLPYLFPHWFERHSPALGAATVAATAAASSLAIELAQLHFNLGLFEFDDVLNNTLGALAGYALYRVVSRLASRRRAKAEAKAQARS